MPQWVSFLSFTVKIKAYLRWDQGTDLTYVSYILSHMPNIFEFPFKTVKQYNLSRERVNKNIVQAKENRLWNTGFENLAYNGIIYSKNSVKYWFTQKNGCFFTKVMLRKSWFKLNIQKMKIMASGPIPSWQIDGKKWKQCQALFSCAPKSLQMVTVAMKLKDTP